MACIMKSPVMQDATIRYIPEAMHQVHQDQPEAVNRLLLEFLQHKVCDGGQLAVAGQKEE